jgi:hypothetical protein
MAYGQLSGKTDSRVSFQDTSNLLGMDSTGKHDVTSASNWETSNEFEFGADDDYVELDHENEEHL